MNHGGYISNGHARLGYTAEDAVPEQPLRLARAPTGESRRVVDKDGAWMADFRNPTDAKRFVEGYGKGAPDVNAGQAAIRTLRDRGYTYHGAEYWRPPLGKRPTWLDESAREQSLGRSLLLNLALRLRWARRDLGRARAQGLPEAVINEAAGAALEAHNSFQAAKQIVACAAPAGPSAKDPVKSAKSGLSL